MNVFILFQTFKFQQSHVEQSDYLSAPFYTPPFSVLILASPAVIMDLI